MEIPSDKWSRGRLISIAWWVLFAIIAVLVVVVRIRLLSFPVERDEGEYAYAGQLITEGIPPYKLAYNMKFPGAYLAYALIMAVGGQTTVAIHAGLLVINALTAAFVFFLSRKLGASTSGAISAAAAYAVMSLSTTVNGLSAHATHFITLIISGALLVLLNAVERKSLALLLGTGALFGLAVLVKQPAIVFVVFAAGFLLFEDIRRQLPGRRATLRVVTFLLGAAIPLSTTAIWLWRAGVFEKFWFWTVRYAAEYGAMVPFKDGFKWMNHRLAVIAPVHAPLWVLSAVGLIALWATDDDRVRKIFLSGLAISSAIAVSAGLYFRAHYFILILPIVALLVGVAITQLARFGVRSRLADGTAIVAVAAALLWTFIIERHVLFEASPEAASRLVYGYAPFPESPVIADYIQKNSAPNDTIAIIGSEPQIYFHSHRHSATGYIYTYPLMEPQKFSQTMQQEMIREIEAAEPRYLVSVAIGNSWSARPGSDLGILNWADEYIARNYTAVGLANLGSEQTDFRFERPTTETPGPICIVVYERNARQ